MTPRALAILRIMAEVSDVSATLDYDYQVEIVCDRGGCWLGTERIRRSTAYQLLRVVALKDVSDVKGLERYEINEIGRALAKRPGLELEITAALAAGGAWQDRGGSIVALVEHGEDRPGEAA